VALRIAISDSVVKTLFALSRNVCSFIDEDRRFACEEHLTDPSWKKVKAEIAHIRGLNPGSARFDHNYVDPNDFENLILLCPNHHNVIDDLEPDRFTVHVLLAMKHKAIERGDGAPWAPDEVLGRFARQLIRQSLLQWAVESQLPRADAEEAKQRLAGAVNRLGDRYKIVMSLYYWESLSLEEIASVLGTTSAEVEILHARALDRIAQTAGLDPASLIFAMAQIGEKGAP
jgi:RNA polymerase sigma factor (sigma-70 family)